MAVPVTRLPTTTAPSGTPASPGVTGPSGTPASPGAAGPVPGWFTPADCRLEDFRRLVEQGTRPGDYPYAA